MAFVSPDGHNGRPCGVTGRGGNHPRISGKQKHLLLFFAALRNKPGMKRAGICVVLFQGIDIGMGQEKTGGIQIRCGIGRLCVKRYQRQTVIRGVGLQQALIQSIHGAFPILPPEPAR